jgi:Toprim-like
MVYLLIEFACRMLAADCMGDGKGALMLTITTHQGKAIEIVLQTELCDPLDVGAHVRAYCHLHGSDHQRSLSIDKATGWGHCFNATCEATVLVAEWNPTLANRLMETHSGGHSAAHVPSCSFTQQRRSSLRIPAVERPPARLPPAWQQEEVTTLLSLGEQMRAALSHSSRAQAYLEERKIPLELALAAGVGYFIPTMPDTPICTKKKGFLQRWGERLIFPLASLAGKGYIGRTLWGWQPGIDENVHKTLLEQAHAPKRWIKTNPAGWFGYDPEQLADSLILVERAFDRLTLLAAGFQASDVIALVGTAAQASWFPAQVKSIILALDADEGGTDAMRRLVDRLARGGFCVRVCPPPQDRWGKDWNERWQRIGSQSVWPIYEAYAASLHSA